MVIRGLIALYTAHHRHARLAATEASGVSNLRAIAEAEEEFKKSATKDQDDDGNPLTNDVTVILRWNDWPQADIDYDLFLFDYDTGTLVASSTTIQNGSQEPVEVIVIDLPDSENYWHNYALEVARKGGAPEGIELEIFLGGRSYFIPFYKYPNG